MRCTDSASVRSSSLFFSESSLSEGSPPRLTNWLASCVTNMMGSMTRLLKNELKRSTSNSAKTISVVTTKFTKL